jgi:RNA polymerase sigma-70 factor (ECF subfamily)
MADGPVVSRFTALYRANYGRVLNFVGRRVGVGRDAEDVTAEVFRIAWMRAADGTEASPGWLFVTARNVIRNHVRSAERARRLSEAVAGDLAVRQASQGGDHDRVHVALDRLREPDRAVLVLRYWDGLDAAEIAAVLDVSVSAVWVRLHRARRAFRASLTAMSGDEHASV